jgi:hypothetical protein
MAGLEVDEEPVASTWNVLRTRSWGQARVLPLAPMSLVEAECGGPPPRASQAALPSSEKLSVWTFGWCA